MSIMVLDFGAIQLLYGSKPVLQYYNFLFGVYLGFYEGDRDEKDKGSNFGN